jgi:hypothetical protein
MLIDYCRKLLIDAGMVQKIQTSKKSLQSTPENLNLNKLFQMALENLAVPSNSLYLFSILFSSSSSSSSLFYYPHSPSLFSISFYTLYLLLICDAKMSSILKDIMTKIVYLNSITESTRSLHYGSGRRSRSPPR